jgi:biopolymer transport protein ExbD
MKIKRFDSINVVPFIDIMLVLLVIVLTTASFVAKGIIPVDLSMSQSASKLKNEKSLTITIKDDGKIFFDKVAVTKNSIAIKLQEYTKNTPINLNCDKNAKFDNFVYVLDVLKEKQYKNLGIITKYE